MIDMHNHILFGVDDGAKTIENSIELIEEEIKKGVSHIILTPHYKGKSVELNMENVMRNFDDLKEFVENKKLNVKLYLGNEIYCDSNFYELFENGKFKTLAGSDYILIEFSVTDTPKNIAEICYEAKIKGYIPIIAHVERYSSLYDDSLLLKDILNEGAHLQVNASTLVNRESKESNRYANFLLKNELISFVASDVHDMGERCFYLDEAYKRVKKTCSESYADKIFYINQQKIISNEYFDTPNIKTDRGRILSKLFRNKD